MGYPRRGRIVRRLERIVPKPVYVVLDIERIDATQRLADHERHACGRGNTAEKRHVEGAEHRCLALVDGDVEAIEHARARTAAVAPAGLDIRAAFERRSAVTAAKQWGSRDFAVALIVGVSPEWVGADTAAERVTSERAHAVLRAAQAWGEATFGPGAVIHARYDVDERGGGVADLIVAPVRTDKRGKRWYSVSQPLRDLARQLGRPGRATYAALRDSWHAWAVQHLDQTIERGIDGHRSGAKLSPEAYGELQDRERAIRDGQARIESEQARIDDARGEVDEEREALRDQAAQLADARWSVMRERDDGRRERRIESRAERARREAVEEERDQAIDRAMAAEQEVEARDATIASLHRRHAREREEADQAIARARAAAAKAETGQQLAETLAQSALIAREQADAAMVLAGDIARQSTRGVLPPLAGCIERAREIVAHGDAGGGGRGPREPDTGHGHERRR